MRIGRGNRSTLRKPAPVPLCPPQTPHDLTWTRTRVGSQRLTAWAMARPYTRFHVPSRMFQTAWQPSQSCVDGQSENHFILCSVHFIMTVSGSAALVDLGRFFSFLILYTVGRTPWIGDQPVAGLTQNKRRQTSIPRVGLEPTIPVFERAKAVHALDRAATVIGHFIMTAADEFDVQPSVTAYSRILRTAAGRIKLSRVHEAGTSPVSYSVVYVRLNSNI
jgi:hypothetical protein